MHGCVFVFEDVSVDVLPVLPLFLDEERVMLLRLGQLLFRFSLLLLSLSHITLLSGSETLSTNTEISIHADTDINTSVLSMCPLSIDQSGASCSRCFIYISFQDEMRR